MESFQRGLLKSNAYDTPERPGMSWAARLLGRSQIWFPMHMLYQVVACSILYRRRGFTARSWAPHSYAIIRAAETSRTQVHIRCPESLKTIGGPVVYVSNHMSVLETFALPCILLPYGMITLVVKQSLLNYPLFGTVMRAVRPIVVGRKDPRHDLKTVLEEGTRVLHEEGRSVVIFPQSTREPTFRPSHFNSLGVKLARKAGVPVVPIALKTDFYGIGRLVRDIGPVDPSKPIYIHVGEPIRVTGNGKEEHEATVRFIADNVRSWGGHVE